MRFRRQIIVREMDQIREQHKSFRLERQALDHEWNILQREQDSLDRECRLFDQQRGATTPNNIFDIMAQFRRQEERRRPARRKRTSRKPLGKKRRLGKYKKLKILCKNVFI